MLDNVALGVPAIDLSSMLMDSDNETRLEVMSSGARFSMADAMLSSEVSEISWTFVAMSVHKPYLAHIQRRYSLDSNLDRLLRIARGQGHLLE